MVTTAAIPGDNISVTRPHELSQHQITQYQQDGFLHVPGFFEPEEIAPLTQAFVEDPTVAGNAFTYEDSSATNHMYAGWLDPRDDLIGVFTTIERIVNGAEALIGDPVYHYHSKIVVKPPLNHSVIGLHHDYSGWYADGCVATDMLTCLVAVTRATKDHGCLRVLKGSHHVGRMDKDSLLEGASTQSSDAQDAGYFGTDPRRLAAILKHYEQVDLEMEPGDAVFFHSTTLHSSGPNSTDQPRIFIEMSYNAAWNEPVLEDQTHHRCRPLAKVADSTIKEQAYTTVFGRTLFLNITDPDGAGAKIFLGNRRKQ